VRAESTVMGLLVQSCKLSAVDMDERGVVTRFEINIGLGVDAVVNDDLEPVALPDRRNSTTGAVPRSTMPFATRSPEIWQTSAVRVDDLVGSCWITSYVAF
jgi:hypothetical protein